MKHLKLLLLSFALLFSYSCSDLLLALDNATLDNETIITDSELATFTLNQNDTQVSFDSDITFIIDNDTKLDNYTIDVSSTAIGGVKNLYMTATSTNRGLKNLLAGIGTHDLANLDTNTPQSILISNLIPNHADIKGANNVTVSINKFIEFAAPTLTKNVDIIVDFLLIDENGRVSETFEAFMIAVPSLFLLNNGVDVGFFDPITFDLSSDNNTDNYTLNMGSITDEGIKNVFIEMTSNNENINNVVGGLGKVDIANITDPLLSIVLSSLIPNHADIKGSDNISIPLSNIVNALSSNVVDNVTLNIHIEVVDSMGSNIDTLYTVLRKSTPPVVKSPPTLTLNQDGVDIGFTNSVMYNIDDIDTADNYTLSLSSSDENGITNFNLTITDDSNNIIDNNSLITNYDLINGRNNVDISLNNFIKNFISTYNIENSSNLMLDIELVDANGNATEELSIILTATPPPIVPPVLSLLSNGVNVGFDNVVTFDLDNLETADNYTLNLTSSAPDGITRFNVSISSSNSALNAIFSGVGVIDVANLDASNSALIAPLIPNHADINGSDNISISLNTIINSLGSSINEETTLTINLGVQDVNGSDVASIEALLTVAPEPPTMQLLRNGANVGFVNSATFDIDNIDSLDNYTLNLSSFDADGITNLNITIKSDSFGSLGSLNSSIDLANVGDDVGLQDFANALVPNYTNIKGSDNISISVTTLVKSLAVSANIINDANMTVDVELVDASGSISETISISLTATPPPPPPLPVISLLGNGTDIGFADNISFNTGDVSAADTYELQLISSASGGITNFFISMESSDKDMNNTLSAIGNVDLANFDNSLLESLVLSLVPNYKSINGNSDINILINSIISGLASGLSKDASLVLSLELVDANGRLSQTLNVDLVAPDSPYDSNPPVMTLRFDGADTSFSGLNVNYKDKKLTNHGIQYSSGIVNLSSTAEGGIKEFIISIETEDNTINKFLGIIANDIDLVENPNTSIVPLLVPNAGLIGGSSSIDLSINTMMAWMDNEVDKYKPFWVNNVETGITIKMILIDDNGRVEHHLQIDIKM